MKMFGCSVVLCLVFGLSVSVWADYYVAPNGDDGNVGTRQAPWRTIQKAVDEAAAGVTIYVQAGTYNERVNVRHSGSRGEYISIENFPGGRPVIDGDSVNEYGFHVTGSYIRIKGFEIKNLKANPAKPNPRSHVAGIAVYSSSHVTIEENLIHNILGGSGRAVFGIGVFSRNGGFVLRNNTIHHVGGYAESFGIWAWTAGAVVRKNLVYFCGKNGIRLTTQSYARPPIVLSDADNLIEQNICLHNSAGLNFNMAYGQPGKLVARNNFSGWNWTLGMQVKHTQNAIIEHNTLFGNGNYGLDFHGVGGSAERARQNVNPILKDNLVSDNRCGVFMVADTKALQNFGETVDYNFYYCPADLILGTFKYVQEPAYYTIETFAAASDTVDGLDHTHGPYEQHGKQGSASPFAAPQEFNFTLKAGSGAKAMGRDDLDAGASAAALAGVGADRNAGLSNIPDLHLLPLKIESFSSESSAGRAAYAIDHSYRTWWEIDTAADATREIVFSLPGSDVFRLSDILLSKTNTGGHYYYKHFALYVDDSSGAWVQVPAPSDHPFTGFRGLYNGEVWRLPSAPRARRVRVKVLNGYGSVIRIPDIRIYGERE